jgi:ribosome biogenesis protein Tsr3
MIAANNHYAGFGPGTVNIFRNMVGMSELSWEDEQQIRVQLQQQKERETNYTINNSNIYFGKKTKKRQTSLTEFTG